jgi:epoxyqueuosine reductase
MPGAQTLTDLAAAAVTRAVKARALALGFDGVAAGPVTSPLHGAAFERWLAAGYAGEMDYLPRGRDARLDPSRLLPGVRSVVAVALSYGPHDDAPTWQPVAAYARGRDYHDVMRPRLAALAEDIRRLGGPETRTRACVDTSAVLERDLAAQVGLGWVGKNTNLLDQRLGSYFFIGIVLTTTALAGGESVADRCGSCTACLDACPTSAFTGPYVLDARRCISYLTIEHRGAIAVELRPALGEWAFGCDVCQTVCPWNRRAAAATEPELSPSGELEPLASLLELDEAAFRARFRGSAITRAKRRGFLRNVAVALGNQRDVSAVPALRRAADHAEPLVRDAARWALRRIGGEEGAEA